MEIVDKSIALNRKMAYVGKLGKSRESFCQSYTKEKKKAIILVTQKLLKDIESEGKTTPCKQGCVYSTCCNEYVEANLQECEAIVYYLYKNENILEAFLKNYEIWRQKEKEALEIYRKRETVRREIHALKNPSIQKIQRMERLEDELWQRYYKLNLPCPFLDNNQCLIYEVRPLMCAAYYSVDPIGLCSPLSPEMSELKRADLTLFFDDRTFYYGKLDLPFLPLMPLGVYRIISEGYCYLSTIRGIANIKNDAMREPEIASIRI
jgi:Fe-S-cluster containining protein